MPTIENAKFGVYCVFGHAIKLALGATATLSALPFPQKRLEIGRLGHRCDVPNLDRGFHRT